MTQVVPKAELKNFIGKQLDAGEWFTIDQERINQFADVTVDHQFIHLDEEKAAQTPFGGTIAHGFLTLSMLSHLVESCSLVPQEIVMGINYGFDKVRFLTPVRAGKRVRAVNTIADVTEKDGGRYLIKQSVVVEIEGEDKPALIAEWLAMHVCG
jgi:acyl dehydratase